MKKNNEVENEFIYTIIILSVIGFFVIAYIMVVFMKKIIVSPINEATGMMIELSKGKLDTRIEVKSGDEIGLMTESMNNFSDTLQNIVTTMDKISRGDLNSTLNMLDAKDKISPALNKIIETLKQLQIETDSLTQAVHEGRTDYRGNADKYSGGYKKIVEGFNNTINEIIQVVRAGEKTIGEISKGDLTARMKGEFLGNFKTYQDYINTLGESLEKLIGEITSAVHAVASASHQISSSSEEMAAGAQEQSSQASEIASAVEEMTSTIFETTKNANNAANKAKTAGSIARKGTVLKVKL